MSVNERTNSIGNAMSGVVTKSKLIEFCKSLQEWHDFCAAMRVNPPEKPVAYDLAEDNKIYTEDPTKAQAKDNAKGVIESRHKMFVGTNLAKKQEVIVTVRQDRVGARFVVGTKDGYVIIARWSSAANRMYPTSEVPELMRFPLAGAKGPICSDKSRYNRYHKKDGRMSMDCADPVALYLREFITIDAVVKFSSSWLDSIKYPLPKSAFKDGWVDEESATWASYLRNRYSNLNNGQQRMLIGAILRKAVNQAAHERDVNITDVINTMPTY